jgi:hypothetical protein
MQEQHREQAFRGALTSANAELEQICESIAQLRARKKQMETAVEALNSLFGTVAPTHESAPASYQSTPVVEISASTWRPSHEPSHSFEPSYNYHPAGSSEPGETLSNQINRALGMVANA